MSVDHVAVGIDLLWDHLAHVRRDRTVPLSEQIRSDAQRGNQFAARVIRSGILNDPTPAKPIRSKRPAPLPPAMTANQLAAEKRNAAIRRRLQREAEESGVAWHIGAHPEAKFIERRYPN